MNNNNNNNIIGERRQSEVRRKTRLGTGLEALNVKPKKEKPLFFVNILIREKKISSILWRRSTENSLVDRLCHI